MNSGEIWVLGGKPGSKGSGVPGPRIGYMPQVRDKTYFRWRLRGEAQHLPKTFFKLFQEIALYGEFTIMETFIYFGWISGMSTEEVKEKMDFFLKLLLLPPVNRQVKNLRLVIGKNALNIR